MTVHKRKGESDKTPNRAKLNTDSMTLEPDFPKSAMALFVFYK